MTYSWSTDDGGEEFEIVYLSQVKQLRANKDDNFGSSKLQIANDNFASLMETTRPKIHKQLNNNKPRKQNLK